ncbi:L-threonylcarbamoyladenylate synthase [Chitinophagaceae bacterium MMS25-I14]
MDFEYDIKNCIRTLEEGGTILYPTDTVWGVGCDALNKAAVERVFALKQRPKEKSLIILLADARDIIQYVAAPPPDIIGIVESFTAPTTVIYEGAIGFPENLVHEDGSIAIRVTDDPFCKALIKRLQRPLVSTSANLSGQPTPAFFNQVPEEIQKGAGYVVQYRQEDVTERTPSQIIRIDDEGNITRIR